MKGLSRKYTIDELRQEISDQCFSAAQKCDPGIYRLYVPTGGGKTYSGLRFCMEMARRQNASHVFYFAPYKSITHQNADCIRKVLGSEYVLEHHSDVIFNENSEEGRSQWIALSQRWQDVPGYMYNNGAAFEYFVCGFPPEYSPTSSTGQFRVIAG